MVLCGFTMIFLGLYGAWMAIRKRLENLKGWFLRAMIIAIFLPFIANTSGWIMTEIGRQPWTVFGLLTTADSVSPSVTAGEVLFSLIAFSAAYLILLGVLIYLFIRTARKGPEGPSEAEQKAEFDPYQSVGGGQVVAE